MQSIGGALGLAMARGVIQIGGGPLCFGAGWLLLVGGVIVAVVVVVVVVVDVPNA